MQYQVAMFAGLGNRLFQFASVYGMAKKNGVDFHVRMSKPNHEHNFNRYEYLFDNFESASISHTRRVSNELPEENDYVLIREVGEQFMDYVPTTFPTEVQKNTLFYGYFQNEAYFNEVREDLLTLFKAPKEVETFLTLVQTPMPNFKNTIAIHVRLGDYKNNPKHFIHLGQYYKASMDLAIANWASRDNANNEPMEFVVVCEEPQYLQMYYAFLCESEYKNVKITTLQRMDEVVTLYYMARCAGVIIANSSFSWWAAYLNVQPNKFITIPSKWINMDGVADTIPMNSQGAIIVDV